MTERHTRRQTSNLGLRAALYMRVSTGAQAKKDLSVPDQRRQLHEYCASKNWTIVDEYSDARTGRDDNRPGFQQMLDATRDGDPPFDVILVHSFSRFFRDQVELELRTREFAKRGIQLVSITQEVSNDAMGDLVRSILAKFDEYNSAETGKHVSRSLAENARQGFFSGGVLPFGFRAVEVERRGSAKKKKLEIEEAEAEVVRLIFDLYRKGDGKSGPLGVTKIAHWLNEHGYRTRGKKRWTISIVHRLLRNQIYMGECWRKTSTGTGEPILITVPAIVSLEVFEGIQRELCSRDPKKLPPQNVGGPILLNSLATCASCGSSMTISTGKSGRYRYYACGGRARQGVGKCKGRRVRMEDLDKTVLTAIHSHLLTYSEISRLIEIKQKHLESEKSEKTERLVGYQTNLSEAKLKLARLLTLVEGGIMESSDPALAERLDELRAERDVAQRAVNNLTSELKPKAQISEEKISTFVDAMNKALSSGDNRRKRSFLRIIIDRVEVDGKELRIQGRKDQIKKAVMRDELTGTAVPSFVRKWRRDRDSNPGNPLEAQRFSKPSRSTTPAPRRIGVVRSFSPDWTGWQGGQGQNSGSRGFSLLPGGFLLRSEA